MTMAAHDRSSTETERSLRLYRGLLAAYPQSFRQEFGDDMVQSFRDLLLFGADGRGVWWRTMRDLVTSAAKERGSATFRGRGPVFWAVFVLAALLVARVVLGGAPPWVLLPLAVLIVLPAFGISQLHKAWVVRRTIGRPVGGPIALGLAALAPALVFLVASGSDAGWWIGVTVALTVIVSSGLGLVWALATLVVSVRNAEAKSRRRRAILVLVPAVVILGVIIGGSYNSYRRNQPPPGDHSVENASTQTRALWEAAGGGDVDEVRRLSGTCADPWVQFPTDDGGHSARGYADLRLLDVPDEEEHPYAEIMDILSETEHTWDDRCGR